VKWNIIGAFIRNDPFGTEIAFRKGLERIGETVNAWDPSRLDERNKFDPDADFTLIFKWLDDGVLRESLVKKCGGKKILYQVDDLRFPHIKQMMQGMLDTCDHALTFDEDGAKLALEYGYKTAKRILLTADNQLYKPIPGTVKDIDVSFIGSLTGGDNHKSRVKMLELVRGIKGVRMAFGNEVFDIPKINDIYNRSKIVLNHATDVGQPFGHGYGYQCRHFEAGFAGSLVLSNAIDNDNTLKNILTFSDEKELVDTVEMLIKGNGLPEWELKNRGRLLYEELMFSHTPEHRAGELLTYARSL